MLVIDEAEPVDAWSMTVTVRNQYTTAQSVSMNLDSGDSSNWVQSKLANGDRTFSLDVEEERQVTVIFTVSSTTLNNLGSDSLFTNLTLWAESQTVSDASSTTLQLQLVKTGSDLSTDGTSGDSDGVDIGSILTWIGFIVVLLIGVGVIFRILTEEEEEDDYGGWGEEGYEGSVEATYGAVAAAPTVPVAGAAYDIPKSLPSISPPAGAPPAAAPPIAPAPTAPSPQLSTAATAPPVPAAGLPDGWTMEQWNVYGQMWLEQNGQA
jgi:hypothetical protein